MKTSALIVTLACLTALIGRSAPVGSIYHDGWIDLNKNGHMDPYENPNLPIEKRIDDLLSRMNVDEKTCQLATLYGYGNVLKDQLPTDAWLHEIWKDGIANIDEQLTGRDTSHRFDTPYAWPPHKHVEALNQIQRFFIEKTRLGIPVDFTDEGIKGLASEKATCFPDQIGLGSTWDVKLAAAVSRITGSEARALGYTNIYSPVLDVARDPRWARTIESFSEDPYLVTQMGLAQVQALQSEGVASTAKHFAVYSMPKGARDGNDRTDPKVTWRDVETIYLAPFRAAVERGHIMGVMSSYNDYNGVPITGSHKFLTEILRQKWGFRGYVVSDSAAVEFIHTKHHVAPTAQEAVRMAFQAGLNVRTNFTSPADYILPLRNLLKEGKISMQTLDDRVRDVLRVKYELGLFDHPYHKNPDAADKIVASPEHEAVARRADLESMVLLKNAGHLLPLKKTIHSILVTGPNADAKQTLMSRYGPYHLNVISVLDGIRRKVGKTCNVKYIKGCNITDPDYPMSDVEHEAPTGAALAEIKRTAALAKTVDVAVVVVGEDRTVVGEGYTRLSLNLPGYQRELVKAIQATGTPTVVVLENGRPLSINWTAAHVPAILEAWVPSNLGGDAVADVLFGDYNPGGKTSFTFPRSVGQLPMNFPAMRGSQLPDKRWVSSVIYPFGYGLSYTTFSFSNLKITPDHEGPEGKVTVSFTLKNTGDRAGDEIPQLYVTDDYSSVVTVNRALRGFKRVHLDPGQSRTVTFTLGPDDLQLYNAARKWVVEPGTFTIRVGSSSTDIKLTGKLSVD